MDNNSKNDNGYSRQRTQGGKSGGGSKQQSSVPSVNSRKRKINLHNVNNEEKFLTAEEVARSERRKQAKRKMVANNTRKLLAIFAVIAIVTAVIFSVATSCINDILVIHIPENKDTSASVSIYDGMTTDQVISALNDAGVIKNGWFCKLAAKIIGYDDDGYIADTYELNRSMGLENMLNKIKHMDSHGAKTIELTFPEGYSADEILALLEEKNVCKKSDIIQKFKETNYSDTYTFLKSCANVDERYIAFEGYLFPDTYEFYIGENADSVIKKFLSNFELKWTSDNEKKAIERNLSIDNVIVLASIVQKEATSSDMSDVASILLNRLDAGMRLECDSTKNYISGNTSGLNSLYDTYQCADLPVGAICNPGTDAIDAVLNAPDSDYYYFIHDTNNEFHAAKSLSEQEDNIARYGVATAQ